jgi:hypothetical protein
MVSGLNEPKRFLLLFSFERMRLFEEGNRKGASTQLHFGPNDYLEQNME